MNKALVILLFVTSFAGALQGQDTEACVFLSNPNATPAFCDEFATARAGGRAGTLDPLSWTFYRFSNQVNPWQGPLDAIYPAEADLCGQVVTVQPDGDSFESICDGAPNYWETGLNDAGNPVSIGSRATQPFDFTGRTGTVTFGVDNTSGGEHSYWTAFWLTDQPVPAPQEITAASGGVFPKNGIAVIFAGSACLTGPPAGNGPEDPTVSVGSVSAILKVTNYKLSYLNFKSGANPCYVVQEDHTNHIEILVNQNQLQVWTTDANPQEDVGSPGPNFRKIASVGSLNLPFTTGYVYFQHDHYDAGKFGLNPNHTYHWHSIGFDGPVLPRDRVYQVPDALQPNELGDGGINMGYELTSSGLQFTLDGVDPTNAAAAFVTLNFNYIDNNKDVQIRYRLNGNTWNTFTDPSKGASNGWHGAVISVNPADLIPGQNILEIARGNVDATLANIDLVVDPKN